MESLGERSVLIIYLLIVLLSSLIGDSIILVSSGIYNEIKLNKVIVVVLQHIAVSDLFRSVSFVLPTIVSLISNSWILGDLSGHIIHSLDSMSYATSCIFVALLTTTKLAMMKLPLRSRGWTPRASHVICSFVWLSAIVFQGYFDVFCQNILFFSYIEYNVAVFLPKRFEKTVIYWYYVISSVIPTVIVILATAAIIFHLSKAREVSRRSGGIVRWQGITAVTATAAVFSIAAVPVTLTFFAATAVSSESKAMFGKVGFVRSSYFITALNIMCNIYIYYLTIPSFRQFIKFKLSRLVVRMLKLFPCSKEKKRNVVLTELEKY
jgi:hypothetical protein